MEKKLLRRDHSTVCNALAHYADRCKFDRVFRAAAMRVDEACGTSLAAFEPQSLRPKKRKKKTQRRKAKT